jgi:hypothetical protein
MTDLEAKIRWLADIEEIRMLKYKYCRYNDGGWEGQPLSHQGPSADLFTEDGVWDGSPVVVARGREEVRKLFAAFASQPMAYHAVMNPIIEIDGDTARGHWHLIGAGVMLDGGSILGAAAYEDEYVRTPDGWRIKVMKVIWGRGTKLPGPWVEGTPKIT